MYRFKKGQQVFMLLDPDFEWDDCSFEVLIGSITKRATGLCGNEYEVTLSNGDCYDMRDEDDIFDSFESLSDYVKLQLRHEQQTAEECVEEAKQELSNANAELRRVKHMERLWQKQCDKFERNKVGSGACKHSFQYVGRDSTGLSPDAREVYDVYRCTKCGKEEHRNGYIDEFEKNCTSGLD